MLRILIVDDSPTEVYKLTTILEKKGYAVEVAETGEEGLEMAKRNPPDLILMDVVMPGLNGFQATRQLSRNPETTNVPIIIVSTKDQATDKVWGMRQGARAYLVKPISETQLLSAISEALS
ncbi:two-component system response regulator [Candidatus Endobugula sertula]|uniref:Two-component system response regulator n=1 Tax=Candidatus Endobugula sertula TaxID=62101 RepID=A0A1D2QSI6_9GAMM|nr:two-component system response regulator [Candidatus Endobugula sertula]